MEEFKPIKKNQENTVDYTNLQLEKVKGLDLKELDGMRYKQAYEYVVKTYGETHIIPGTEFKKFLSENPDKLKEMLDKEILEYSTRYPLFGSPIEIPNDDDKIILAINVRDIRLEIETEPFLMADGPKWTGGDMRTGSYPNRVLLIEK